VLSRITPAPEPFFAVEVSRMRRLLLSLVGLCVLLSAGCQSLSYETTITIEKGSPYQETEFKGPKSEQKVTATISSDEPVSLYLVLMDNKDEAVNALLQKRKPTKPLAAKEETKEATLEATIPAGKPFAILIRPVESKKDIEVKLDVKGK
jgi:hypothetical protein